MKEVFLKLGIVSVLCLFSTSCVSEDVEAYKQKMIEAQKKKMDPLELLFYEAMAPEFDSLSIVKLTVQDSLNILEIQRREIDEMIDENKKCEHEIKDLEKKGFRGSFDKRIKHSKLTREYQEKSKEIEKMENAYKESLAKFDGMDKDKVLNKVLLYKVKYLEPVKKTENIMYDATRFSPDGEHCIIGGGVKLFNYFKGKNKK